MALNRIDTIARHLLHDSIRSPDCQKREDISGHRSAHVRQTFTGLLCDDFDENSIPISGRKSNSAKARKTSVLQNELGLNRVRNFCLKQNECSSFRDSEKSEHRADKNCMRLCGKVAVVTGAAGGIGRATALLFAEHGAKILCVDLQRDLVHTTAREICSVHGKDCAYAFCADVSDDGDARGVVRECTRRFGRPPEIYFANAGIVSMQHIDQLSGETFEKVLRVNTLSCFLAMKYASAAIKLFDEQQKSARVSAFDEHQKNVHTSNEGEAAPARPDRSFILTASVAGLRSGAGDCAYSASKAALVSLAQTGAFQLASAGIRVNALCPGLVETAMTAPLFELARRRKSSHKLGQLSAVGRTGRVLDVARAALFLASEESSFITGQALSVCGGLSASLPTAGRKDGIVPLHRQ